MVDYLVNAYGDFVDRAESFAHSKSLGGGFAGHVLGYPAAALSYVLIDGIAKTINPFLPDMRTHGEHGIQTAVPAVIERPEQAPAQIKMPPRRNAYRPGRRPGRSTNQPNRRYGQNVVRIPRALVNAAARKAAGMARASSGGGSKAKGAPKLRYKRRFFRNRPNAGAKINSVTGRKLIRSMMTPPSTYNATVSTGTYVKLTHGAKYSVVHSRIPIGDVYLNYQPDEAYPNLYIEMFDTGAAIGGSHFLGGNTGYLPDPIHDLICLFQEHNYFSACYEFTPRVTGGTTTGYGITWGFSADPMYGKEHNITGNFPSLFTGYGYTPSENQVKAMDGSTQFPAWVPTACYDVTSKLERKWKYTAGQDIVTGLFNPNDNPATNRQCYSGCFFLSGRSNARTDIESESIVLLGTLWLTTKIGVREFAPAATLSVAFSKATRLINRLHGTEHMKLLLEHISGLSDKKIIMHKGKVKTIKKKKKDDEKSDDVELELLDDVELVSGETARSYLDKKEKEKERTRSSTPARSVSSRAA